jgi:hypothetical protein
MSDSSKSLGWVADIEAETVGNKDFRRALRLTTASGRGVSQI